jgi:hypothetical protein
MSIEINFDSAKKIYANDQKTMLGYLSPVLVSRNFNDESFVLIVSF